jgi:hypothetical protein
MRVLQKLQFFMELLNGRVCGVEFMEQSQIPPKNVAGIQDI